jgi:hypothetical protein
MKKQESIKITLIIPFYVLVIMAICFGALIVFEILQYFKII